MKLRLFLVVLVLSLVGSNIAPAMSTYVFAKMKNGDQADYIDAMVEGAAKMLKDQGHPDQGQKVLDLFGDASKNGGVNQFVLNLKSVDATNRKNAINPNNRHPVLQVEDAMELTFKDNGIIVPASYLLTINRNFMPTAIKLQNISQ